MLLLPLVLLVTPPPSTPDVVRFTTTTIVYVAPDKAAARTGIAGKDTRAKIVQTLPAGAGCSKRWIEIEPRGWACETSLVPSTEPPSTAVAPTLDDDREPEMGVYGAVYRDAVAYDSRA